MDMMGKDNDIIYGDEKITNKQLNKKKDRMKHFINISIVCIRVH